MDTVKFHNIKIAVFQNCIQIKCDNKENQVLMVGTRLCLLSWSFWGLPLPWVVGLGDVSTCIYIFPLHFLGLSLMFSCLVDACTKLLYLSILQLQVADKLLTDLHSYPFLGPLLVEGSGDTMQSAWMQQKLVPYCSWLQTLPKPRHHRKLFMDKK